VSLNALGFSNRVVISWNIIPAIINHQWQTYNQKRGIAIDSLLFTASRVVYIYVEKHVQSWIMKA
jgi:hypothetical protein